MVTEMESAEPQIKEEDVKMEVKTETNGEEEKKEESPEKKNDKKPKVNPEGQVNLYRVKVSGLPRFYSTDDPLLSDFKKMLREELKLEFMYIRSPKKGNSWLYITFQTLEAQKKALSVLRRYTWKNRTIIGTLVVADLRKRKTDDQSNGTLEKKAKYDIPIEEQMLMSTIPYHSVSYEEQLSKKNEETVSLLKWLTTLIEKRNHLLSGYFDKEAAQNSDKLPLKLDPVRKSPVVDGYRNKCEFRIGKNSETGAYTVGYRVDNQEDGTLGVAPPDSLRHLPKPMIDIVKTFELFVDEWEKPAHSASNVHVSLKLLTVRINKTEEIMLVITAMLNEAAKIRKEAKKEDGAEGDKEEDVFEVKPEALESLKVMKKAVIEFFTKGRGVNTKVVSLYLFLEKDKQSGGEHKKLVPCEEDHIWGAKFLEEEVLGLKLEVTPEFYFQCNTHSAEVLYEAVAELASVNQDTTVLDLCCGSGGMGMVLAKQAKEVLGIELMDANVEGAKRLSLKNGLDNCEFVQGKIDDVYPQLEEKLKGKKVVSILDPPRAGISQSMIVNLRKLTEADRLIYVCSNHKLPLKNILDLATVEQEPFNKTQPFVPTRVIPVDVSPHTLRCELVVLCERLDMTKLPKPTRIIKKAQPAGHSMGGAGYRMRKRPTYGGGGPQWGPGGRGAFRGSSWGPKMRGGFGGRGGGLPLGVRGKGGPIGRGGLRGGPKGGMKKMGGPPPPLMGGYYPKPKSNFGGPPPVSARDSLYPPPLRDALYSSSRYGNGGGFGGGGGGGGMDYMRRNQEPALYNRRMGGGNYGGNSRSAPPMNHHHNTNYANDNFFGSSAFEPYDYETRYSNFRRDFEDAINSYPQWGGGDRRGVNGRNVSNMRSRNSGGWGGGGSRGGTWR
ncbi:tRNA (uracil(54)-C(5))-methyltransferase homolog [Nilaparvata lugens]|uniref:tRNA (uracil(54)-C(5))-methyltransferase homolog n=1 Tax=Nilaparvata lugens TaxID=108931 RepID=UPI00193D4E48|nr:tRNA (uracil(54)-C(5))-methyltransferase homolog [Nilaparvata lugens]XP_039292758.1 tRNA (uracil(54)-C(5))-methyltransferase homolog [Nilaparvata lugens]